MGVSLEHSSTYLSHLLTDLDETNDIQSKKFHRLHIYIYLECHTPSRGHGTWGVWQLGGVAAERSFTYLSHLLTDLDEINDIKSIFFH